MSNLKNSLIRTLEESSTDYLRITMALSIISHTNLICKYEDITVYEVSLLKLLTEITQGGRTEIDKGSVKIRPGNIIGGTYKYKCSGSMPLTYYLEPLVYLTPFASDFMSITITLDDEKTEYTENYPSLECFCSVATMILKSIGCENVLFKYKEPYEVMFQCSPIRKIEPINASLEGKVKRIRGTVQVRTMQPALGKSMIIGAKRVLDKVCDNVWIALASPPGKTDPTITISLVAEGIHDCIYTSDGIMKSDQSDVMTEGTSRITANSSLGKILKMANRTVKETNEPTLRERIEKIGQITAERLCSEINLGGVLDTTHQHLPLIFMSLSGDHRISQLRLSKLTRYTTEVMRKIQKYFNVKFKFDQDGESLIVKCIGINHVNISISSW